MNKKGKTLDTDRLLKKHGIGRGKIDIKTVLDLLEHGEQIAAMSLIGQQSGADQELSKELCEAILRDLE